VTGTPPWPISGIDGFSVRDTVTAPVDGHAFLAPQRLHPIADPLLVVVVHAADLQVRFAAGHPPGPGRAFCSTRITAPFSVGVSPNSRNAV
jgi:hypothetical protein